MKTLTYIKNEPVSVLVSESDFEKWYLQYHDFSMFAESEVKKVMQEERPDYYPCIPLVSANGYEINYIGIDHVECLYAATSKKG